jgi:hypothetical protein
VKADEKKQELIRHNSNPKLTKADFVPSSRQSQVICPSFL